MSVASRLQRRQLGRQGRAQRGVRLLLVLRTDHSAERLARRGNLRGRQRDDPHHPKEVRLDAIQLQGALEVVAVQLRLRGSPCEHLPLDPRHLIVRPGLDPEVYRGVLGCLLAQREAVGVEQLRVAVVPIEAGALVAEVEALRGLEIPHGRVAPLGLVDVDDVFDAAHSPRHVVERVDDGHEVLLAVDRERPGEDDRHRPRVLLLGDVAQKCRVAFAQRLLNVLEVAPKTFSHLIHHDAQGGPV
eukprot:scaffold1340_cov253-Pinguiococcus_pyrenoidosus.AAC.31